jgi:transcriptional regulator with GAF, ATPase, and Fis domain
MRAETAEVGLAELALAEPDIWGDAAKAAARMQDGAPLGFSAAKQHAIELFERRYLTSLMERAGGNVSRAAQLSRTERRQLGKLLKRHGIAHYGSSFEPKRELVETA